MVSPQDYASGFVYSKQSELESLDNPENYMGEVQEARKLQTQKIQEYGKIASEPLSSHSRAAWRRRNQAKKELKKAKAASKKIAKEEKQVKEQVKARKVYLQEAKEQEKTVYIEAAKAEEKRIEEEKKKQEWITKHGIGDIPEGIRLGYLDQSRMSTYYEMQRLINQPNRRKYPTRLVAEMQFKYKGGTQKEWDALLKHEDTQQKASERKSASIKAGAAIEEAGGILGGKYTGTSADGSLMGSDLKVTSTDPKIAAANQAQSAYVAQLRSGGIGLAQALLQPKTEQKYYVGGKQVSKAETSINLEKFLTERGYDITKPESIPDSIFKAPVKYTAARAQTVEPIMGDLREKVPASPKITQAELDKRKKIQEKFGLPDDPPALIITKTQTKTTEPVLISAKEEKLPPGFESGEAVPLFNTKADTFEAGFLGYGQEIYGSIDNLFREEDKQKYYQPSIESALLYDAMEHGKYHLGFTDEIPPSITADVFKTKSPAWIAGSAAASLALWVSPVAAVKLWHLTKVTKAKILLPKQLAQVTKFADDLFMTPKEKAIASEIIKTQPKKYAEQMIKYGKSEKYNIEKLGNNKFLVSSGLESSPTKSPAIIVDLGKKGKSIIFSEYQPSLYSPGKITVSGGMKGGELAKSKEISKFLHEAPATPENLAIISDPKISQFLKPVGTEVTASTKELLKYPKTIVSAVENPAIYKPGQGIIVESQALKFSTQIKNISPTQRGGVPKIGSKDIPKKNYFENLDIPKTKVIETTPKEKIISIAKEIGKTETKPTTTKPLQAGGFGIVITEIGDATPASKPMPTKSILAEPKSISLSQITPKTAITPIADTSSIVGTKEKQRQVTTTVTKQIATTRQVPVVRNVPKAAITFKIKTKTALALVTPLAPMPRIPTKVRPAVAPIYIPTGKKVEQRKKKKKKSKPRKDFLGNVSEVSILGVYKRKDITYGRKKITKLQTKDKRLFKTAKNKLITPKESSLKRRRKKTKKNIILGFVQPKPKRGESIF